MSCEGSLARHIFYMNLSTVSTRHKIQQAGALTVIHFVRLLLFYLILVIAYFTVTDPKDQLESFPRGSL